MLASRARSRSTRRTATVTISAPLASIARTISSLSAVLPRADHEAGLERPRADRERRVCSLSRLPRNAPARSRRRAPGAGRPAPGRRTILRLCSTTTARGSSPSSAEQLEQCGIGGHGPALSVHTTDFDHANASNRSRAAAAGSGASHRAPNRRHAIHPGPLQDPRPLGDDPPDRDHRAPEPTISSRRSTPRGHARMRRGREHRSCQKIVGSLGTRGSRFVQGVHRPADPPVGVQAAGVRGREAVAGRAARPPRVPRGRRRGGR